jgi:predicted metal-dependent phosphotriesterase family hydrolase
MAKAKTQADDPMPSTVISAVSNTSAVSAVDNVNLSTVAKEDAKVLASQTDVFLSHDWGVNDANHKRVSRINDYLKANGIKTWFDEDRLGGGRLNSQLSQAIKYTSIAIVFCYGELCGQGPGGREV